MPTYSYSCEEHGVFELTLPLRKWDDHKPCPKCKKSSEQVLLPSAGHGAFATPVVVHIDKDGNVRYPGSIDDKPPRGFERKEIRTVRELEQFERTMNHRYTAEAQQHQENEERFFGAMQAKSRSELRQAMQRMSPLGRDFAELAIRLNNEKKRKKLDPGFHCQILHFDQSNREPHRDERTGWKRRWI